jgi:3-dehydroquinate synthase
METIQIQTSSKSYNVFVGEGIRTEISHFLNKHFANLTRILIITDETVEKIHLDKVVSLLSEWNPVIFTAPSGEKAKTFEVYYEALSVA